ncbi:hypothetical protein [Qipengyuania marisflavi]|uniref:PilZ domain-containing protein n=1 Tax=Qipengyuania marisflavi TaxID=2486356 RepID=A0A5S3PA82_9SPHN|nr:hypothetical protein [Qipengyuania marisflavi]TMM50361.1 hypothetical protein FEV51_04085 [Qipengyuania marisflavi]
MIKPTHKPRIAVNEAAILRRSGADDMACTIIDVSKEGFRIKVAGAVPVGADYQLSYGGETHKIAVRWASMGEVGGEFLA